MSFILIKGTFHVKGYSPDGDSIRFQADNPANWNKLSGPAVGLNALEHAQLRIEAIDAPETHYQGFHQPLRLARAAGRYLLSALGIHEVVWDETQSVVISAQDGTRGFILSRTTESRRRPVAFVFAGDSDLADGGEAMLDVNLLKKSVNYRLLASGLAYPMYYNGLFSDLRAAFTQSMIVARSEGRGLWPYDGTTTGFSVSDLQTLTDEVVVLPKLFRRIIEYIGNGGKIDDFKEHLLKGCDPLVRLPAVDFTRLDAVVDVQGDLVRLTELPENLVFLDKVLCKKS